jgi:hypothetical protein
MLVRAMTVGASDDLQRLYLGVAQNGWSPQIVIRCMIRVSAG